MRHFKNTPTILQRVTVCYSKMNESIMIFASHTKYLHLFYLLFFVVVCTHFTEEKLAESTAANGALSAQLENISPQLNSLENSLNEARHKLKEEQKLRRAAEQAQDEADQRLREMEQSLAHLREECDMAHEELAFKENELEEMRLELEVEKQDLLNELSTVRSALSTAEQAAEISHRQATTAQNENNMTRSTIVSSTIPEEEDTSDIALGGSRATDSVPLNEVVPTVDEGYVKKLEEELELVTEQLIETEKRLGETEGQLTDYLQTVESLKHTRRDEDDDMIRTLEADNAELRSAAHKLREELFVAREELSLAREEIQLQQEELHAAEADAKAVTLTLEEERIKQREVVNQLHIKLKETEASSDHRLGEAAMVASTVKAANEENARLTDQVDALEQALNNARQDYQNVVDELDAVNARFDEVRREAKEEGREEAVEELKQGMMADTNHEIQEMREQLAKLAEENNVLQQKVDDAEMSLAKVKDTQESVAAGADAHSEVTKQLQSQLTRAKEELAKKDQEMTALTKTLETRVAQAEESVTTMETELRSTKGQLAEAEARVIVLRRDKERAEKSIPPPSPTRRDKKTVTVDAKMPPVPGLEPPDLGNEFSDYDEVAIPRRSRSPPTRMRHRSRSSSPSSVMRLEYRLAEESKKLQDLQKEYDALMDQKRMGEIRIKRLEGDLQLLNKELFANGGDTAVVTQMSRLSSLANKDIKEADLIETGKSDSERVNEIISSRDVKLMVDELRSLEKKCNGQREYNAQLLSKMLHLQGNIQVYSRVRPMTMSEVQKGYKTVVESLSETELGCFDSRTNKWKSFAFDRVWGPDQSQQSVFQDVEPVALSVVDGYNACIFAYGQTGSGKTFTMEGVPEGNQYGISYRTIQKIFHLLSLRAQQQRAAEIFVGSENENEPAKEVSFSFSLELGMLEIYNDEVYDLLSTEGSSMAEKKEGAMRAGGKASLEIRRSKEGRIEVPNLTKEKVESIQEVMQLLKTGNGNRATASTDMNEHSSRSHMVLIVDVYSGVDESQRNKGTLYLVDLAGSERVRKSNVQGDQLKEAGFINKSLSALGNVMEALDRKASHVPYRDSKLTYLLQDSLGGNSRTLMVVTISPMDMSYDESVHALQFATRVRRIQIGAAQRNVTSKNLEETVKALTEEMRSLTRAKERTESQLLSLKRDNTRVQDKLQNLSKARQQNRSEGKTLDVLKKNNDDLAARWQKEKTAREEAVQEADKAKEELRKVQQQLSQGGSKVQLLTRKLEEKEAELEKTTKQLRQATADKAAAALRSRRQDLLNTRHSTPVVKPTAKPAGSILSPTNVSRTATGTDRTQVTSTASDNGDSLKNSEKDEEEPNAEVALIRQQVLELLEKHDKGKADRIDIIMEKFKGKEALLLDKMTQRYEGGAGATPAVSVQKRNEQALARHQERMLRIREKKNSA
jgi:DNA repair exonuclease SbcCD ATPase subunit